MNGINYIEEILAEKKMADTDGCTSNVHVQTWHDSWRNSH